MSENCSDKRRGKKENEVGKNIRGKRSSNYGKWRKQKQLTTLLAENTVRKRDGWKLALG